MLLIMITTPSFPLTSSATPDLVAKPLTYSHILQHLDLVSVSRYIYIYNLAFSTHCYNSPSFFSSLIPLTSHFPIIRPFIKSVQSVLFERVLLSTLGPSRSQTSVLRLSAEYVVYAIVRLPCVSTLLVASYDTERLHVIYSFSQNPEYIILSLKQNKQTHTKSSKDSTLVI